MRISKLGRLLGSIVVATSCNSVWSQPFLPDFSMATFSNSLQIDNPYFPLVAGKSYIYDVVNTDPDTSTTETELILVEVLPQTKVVSGVETRVVRDRVWLEGLLIEDTFDWYAQDDTGNVWYMGEYVTDYFYDEFGMVIGTNHDGSWEAGIDGALPGYLMEANPLLGDYYYQEFYAGSAEDEGAVIGLGETHTVPYGMFSDVLRTRDTTALDPSALEHKFYAPGVGKILGYKFDEDGEIVGTTVLRAVVPEPSTFALLGLALTVLCGANAQRRYAHRS